MSKKLAKNGQFT